MEIPVSVRRYPRPRDVPLPRAAAIGGRVSVRSWTLSSGEGGGRRAVIERLRTRLTYANVVATGALFIALGGTSYAVLRVGSDESSTTAFAAAISVIARFTAEMSAIELWSLAICASTASGQGSSRVGTRSGAAGTEGGTFGRCDRAGPKAELPRGYACTSRGLLSARHAAPDGFLGANDVCDAAARALPSMPQLDRFARINGPLPQAEWTGSVYRNVSNGPTPLEQLEAVVLDGAAA